LWQYHSIINYVVLLVRREDWDYLIIINSVTVLKLWKRNIYVTILFYNRQVQCKYYEPVWAYGQMVKYIIMLPNDICIILNML